VDCGNLIIGGIYENLEADFGGIVVVPFGCVFACEELLFCHNGL
jgi:hypothetical protein